MVSCGNSRSGAGGRWRQSDDAHGCEPRCPYVVQCGAGVTGIGGSSKYVVGGLCKTGAVIVRGFSRDRVAT
jgi:hypothetical protein